MHHPASEDPYRPAREDRDSVVEGLVDRLPDRVTAALEGDRDALIGLLMIAADVAWQGRAEILGTVQEVAESAHRFADEVADCYSADRPPSDRMCDTGFAMAERVDALAIEVLRLRAEAGISDDSALTLPREAPAREVRHLARAHLAALRDAAERDQPVTQFDIQAAEHLYRAAATLNRQWAAREAAIALAARPPLPNVPRRKGSDT